MPMQITVTRNRKTSENYNSEGHGISLSVELDQSLLTNPRELQEKINFLYAEADAALDRQDGPRASNGTGGRSGSGSSNGHNGDRTRRNGSTMTAAQSRAILSIARRLGLDAEAEVRDEFGFNLDDLTLKQASLVIDHLKQLQRGEPSGQGARR